MSKNSQINLKQAQQSHPAGQDKITTIEAYQGPFPSPAYLEHYKALDPELPALIFREYEQEGRYRRRVEIRTQNQEFAVHAGSILLAFAAVLAVLYAGCYFMLQGYPNAGATLICTVAVALALAFLTRRHPPAAKGKSPE